MTNLPSPGDAVVLPARLVTPTGVIWMLFSAPFLLAMGAFITVAMLPFVNVVSAEGNAVLMAWLGVIMLCLGVAFLVAGIALVGFRSILQQQTELLRSAQPGRDGG